MDEKIEKILEIKVDTDNAIKSLNSLGDALKETQKNEKELQKEIDELSKSEVENADAIEAKKDELAATKELEKDYKRQINEVSKEIQNNIKMEQEKAGSLRGLRAELGNLTKQYDALSREEREGTKGKEMQQHINDVTTELKDAEEATQRYQRNVGNYENSIKAALGGNSKFVAGMQNLSGAMKNGVGPALNTAGTAVKSFGKQLLSLLANPIVAVIAGIAAVVMMVAKGIASSEEKTARFNKVLAPLKVLADAVTVVLQKMAGVILSILEGAGRLFEWIGGLLEKLPVVGKYIAEINEQNQKYIAIEQEKYAIAKDTRQLEVDNAKAALEAAKLKADAKDKERLSDAERLEAIRKANDIEEEMMQKEVDLAKRRFENAKAAAEMTENTKETNDELSHLEAEMYNKEKAYFDKKKELLAQEMEIRIKINEQAKKHNDELIKTQVTFETTIINLIKDSGEKAVALENMNYKKSLAELQRKMDEEKRKYGERSELYRLYMQQMTAIEMQHLDNLDRLSLESQKKEIETAQNTIALKLEVIKAGSDNEYELKRQQIENQMNLELMNEELTGEQRLLIKEKYAQIEVDIEKAKQTKIQDEMFLSFENKINEAKLNEENYLQLEVEYAKLRLDSIHQLEEESDSEFKARMIAAQQEYVNNKKTLADAEVAIEKAKANAMATLTGSISDMLEDLAGDNKEMVMASKVMALAEVSIKQGVAIAEAVASSAAGDPYTYALRVAAAIASTVTAMAKAITSINSAKFAQGGKVRGAGTSTSDSIPAMLSNGEFVVNAKAASMFPGLLESINSMGRGIGSPASMAATYNSESTTYTTNNYNDSGVDIAEVIRNIPAPVVSVEEINRVSRRVKVIENASSV